MIHLFAQRSLTVFVVRHAHSAFFQSVAVTAGHEQQKGFHSCNSDLVLHFKRL